MATFASARYPQLTLQDADGVWAQFADGQFETDDPQVAERLRGLPEEEKITEVKDALSKAPAKKTTAPKTPPAPKE